MTTENKIRSFLELPIGWRYGFGGPISENNVIMALTLCNKIINLGFDADAFPSPDGEILLTGYHGNEYITVMIYNDQFSFSHETNDSIIVWVENLMLDELYEKLIKVTETIFKEYNEVSSFFN